MPSKETIEDLRSQIDAILQAQDGHNVSKHAKRRGISSAEQECMLAVANAEHAKSSDGSGDEVFKRIVSLLNASEKSERKIRERLYQLDFIESEIEPAIARAKEYGFIDDIRYGEVLVRSRVAQGRGSAGIERELYDNDINPFDIPGYPEEFGINPDLEFERALDLLRRKPPRAKNAREAAYRKLVQKGFPVSVASSAARAWHESLGA